MFTSEKCFGVIYSYVFLFEFSFPVSRGNGVPNEFTGSPSSRHENAKDEPLAVCETGRDPSEKAVLGYTAAVLKI